MAQDMGGSSRTAREPLVAIQVGAISFADEGVEQVLEILQERAGVNALMLACFTFTRGTGGRQVPGQPLPDHGVQEYDDFIGGSFTAIHPQYYAKTCITEFRAPDRATRDMDVMEAVLPACQRRGIAVYAWTVESIGMHVPNVPKVLQQDIFGRPQPRGCYANPDYRSWILSFQEDYCKSWPISGVMWGSERRGPFETTLLGEVPYCFCEHCRANGRARGIDLEQAHAGYEALYTYAQAARRGQRPRDGYFVELWRILFQYPEILQWEKLWFDQQQELHQQIYGLVKATDRTKTVGWHSGTRTRSPPSSGPSGTLPGCGGTRTGSSRCCTTTAPGRVSTRTWPAGIAPGSLTPRRLRHTPSCKRCWATAKGRMSSFRILDSRQTTSSARPGALSRA